MEGFFPCYIYLKDMFKSKNASLLILKRAVAFNIELL